MFCGQMAWAKRPRFVARMPTVMQKALLAVMAGSAMTRSAGSVGLLGNPIPDKQPIWLHQCWFSFIFPRQNLTKSGNLASAVARKTRTSAARVSIPDSLPPKSGKALSPGLGSPSDSLPLRHTAIRGSGFQQRRPRSPFQPRPFLFKTCPSVYIPTSGTYCGFQRIL